MFVSVYGAVYLIGPRSCETALAGWGCHSFFFILVFFQWRYLKQAEIRDPALVALTDGAVMGPYPSSTVWSVWEKQDLRIHSSVISGRSLWTSKVPKGIRNKIFFLNSAIVVSWRWWLPCSFTMLLSRKKRPGLTGVFHLVVLTVSPKKWTNAVKKRVFRCFLLLFFLWKSINSFTSLNMSWNCWSK